MAFQNFYSSKISNDIGSADTSITVDNAPTATNGRMTLESRNPTQREIIKYTGVAGNVLTGVIRGQGTTTAKAHIKGSLIQMNATSEDLQDLYDSFNSFAPTNSSGWFNSPYTFNSVTYLGNRSYSCVVNGQNLTNIYSPGVRVRTTRTVAAPTQCTSLNGTTQYWSKTAPAGMTFTDDFVVSAWVKLTAYGINIAIASRFDGTSGWYCDTNSSGQVRLVGSNAGAANFSLVQSFQSIPLNKWVHIVAQLDMSTFTATTTTSYIMVDGVDVPSTVSRGGTNPTALIQAGTLNIGASNGGTTWNGKLAQTAVFSAKVTQATIQSYYSQGLLGTEPNLVSGYSFNNTVNDLNTTNANNLTASGSAVATNADSPFGGQGNGTISSTLDYGIIQSAAFSTNTTVVVQVPEGCTIPTSGGVASVVYSSNAVPFNFPKDEHKWKIASLFRANEVITFSAINIWQPSVGAKVTLPIGSWKRLGYQGPLDLSSTLSGIRDGQFLLYNTATTPTNAVRVYPLITRVSVTGSTDGAVTASIYRDDPFVLTAAATYNMAAQIFSASGTETWYIFAAQGEFEISAINALL